MSSSSPPATLLPLYASPAVSATQWATAAAHGRGALAVIRLDPAGPGAPASGSRHSGRSRRSGWPIWAAGIDLLRTHGVRPLAHISLGYGTRPISEIISEISRWTVLSVAGIFFDLAPASPYLAGPVLRGVRHARRAGLTTIVLNPGVPVDPLYRRLNATICTFEGSWPEYLEWSGDGTSPGDGHLVYGIPDRHLGAARALAAARRAGLVLLSDRTAAEAGRGRAGDLPVAADA